MRNNADGVTMGFYRNSRKYGRRRERQLPYWMKKPPPDPPPDPDPINQPSSLHIRDDEDDTPLVIVLPVTGRRPAPHLVGSRRRSIPQTYLISQQCDHSIHYKSTPTCISWISPDYSNAA